MVYDEHKKYQVIVVFSSAVGCIDEHKLIPCIVAFGLAVWYIGKYKLNSDNCCNI